jgi:hypothetical protein
MDASEGDNGAGEPRQVDQDELSDEEVLIVDDLGNELDDAEDWLGQGPEVWAALPEPPAPTRLAWLRHLFAQGLNHMRDCAPRGAPAWPAASERVPEAEWSRLCELAFGPESRWVCGEVVRVSVSAADCRLIVVTERG